MDFHSSLSCATSGFVINLTPVYHLSVASAVSWLRREQRSWFCRHEKAQDSLHQKDLTILLFPTPACTCSRLERGQWSDCHTGTFPPSGISSVCSWPVILGARISIHGQQQAGNSRAVAAAWAGEVPVLLCQEQAEAKPSQTLPHSCPSPSFLPPLPWSPGMLPQEWDTFSPFLRAVDVSGCKRRREQSTKHRRCPSLQEPGFCWSSHFCILQTSFLSHKPGALWPLRKLTYLLIFLRPSGCNSVFITSDFQKIFLNSGKSIEVMVCGADEISLCTRKRGKILATCVLQEIYIRKLNIRFIYKLLFFLILAHREKFRVYHAAFYFYHIFLQLFIFIVPLCSLKLGLAAPEVFHGIA